MKNMKTMKCCVCDKDVRLDGEPPPKWFGKYNVDKLIRVICRECVMLPENKDWWKD